MSEAVSETPRSGRLKKWRPKRWRPEYDRIVAYSVMGKSNIWIAENLNFTPEHVSTILNQPQAQELITKLQAKLRERITVNIPDVLGEIAEKAVIRLKEAMNDDALFEKSPFAVIDRGLDVLKGLNHLKTGSAAPAQQGGNTYIGTAIIAPAQKSDLLDGLQKVAEVRQLHGSNTPILPRKE